MKTGYQSPIIPLISAAQNLTASWVDLGFEIDCKGYDSLGLWLTLDINDTNNARVRVLVKHTKAGSEEYVLPIRTVSASDVKVEDEYIEFNTDADQKMVLSWQLDNVIPFIQIQVMAGTVGASAGQIDAAYATLGY